MVVHLAPGDRLLPGALRRLAATLDADPVAVATYPAFRVLGEGSTTIETVVPDELDVIEILRLQQVPAGPGAMFRREPALEAIRSLGAGRFDALIFWLRLAAKGSLRRVAEPLACRSTAESRPAGPGGIPAARERIATLEQAIAELELPPGSERVVASAARSAFVLAAAEIDDGFNQTDERVCVVDRCSLLPRPEQADLEAEIVLLEAKVADLERLSARQQVAVSVLEAAVQDRARGAALGQASPLKRSRIQRRAETRDER